MSLRLSEIQLTDFRSYQRFSLEEIDDLTILFGPNAAGKTNIIEAIQMVTALSSFRKASVEQMIRQGCSTGRIRTTITDGHRLLDLDLILEDGRRMYQLNGKEKNIHALKGLAPSITFSPDDLEMVKGPDGVRRDEVDHIGSQVNANYYQLIRDFRKTLKHRNRLLKEEAQDTLLDSLTDLYMKVAMQLTAYRRALLERMTPQICKAYERVSDDETLSVEYELSWEGHDDIAAALTQVREYERERKQTVVGPHRDHIRFKINGMDAGAFASQGQQRSIVLAVKMAEVQLIEEMLDQKPILLLDDVMSELDIRRRNALVDRLLPNTQTFITTANLDYFSEDILDRARIVEIRK